MLISIGGTIVFAAKSDVENVSIKEPLFEAGATSEGQLKRQVWQTMKKKTSFSYETSDRMDILVATFACHQ